MPKLTDEQKRANRIARMFETFRTYTLGKCKTIVARDFQKLVKLKAADQWGRVSCFTCERKLTIGSRELHAGHFISRSKSKTLLDPMNCHPQCNHCNTFLGGHAAAYRIKLLDKYGTDEVLKMERRANQPHQFQKLELVHKRIEYLDEIKQQERRIKRETGDGI